MESNGLYTENRWNGENRKKIAFILHNPFIQSLEIIRT